ncbi:MAG: 50S ribosomal protein L22 [Candidatus Abawacabacteria bacterium]|nr:50S ribosomal protein L22 [Candidatus Abawacabacteria bacterium]
MKAYSRYLRISPYKLLVVAGIVQGKDVNYALNFLKYLPKKGAGLLYKVIKSAASNAENNFKVPVKNLKVEKIVVNKGPALKRGLAVSRGRWHPILKRTSYVAVELAMKE